jgi:hypothetical protein
MVSPVTAYNLWDTRQSLGVMREVRPEPRPFSRFFPNQLRSTAEYIDFEKLPLRSRRLAPFVKPLGQGKGIHSDKANGYRFKPANVVVEETVDPLRPLTYQPGIDSSMFDVNQLSPTQRNELIKVEMTAAAIDSIERRWEWMRAQALINATCTFAYLDGTSVTVDFQRDSGHTETLGSGSRFGDSGVSVMDKLQSIIDTMNDAEFGALPVQIEMGSSVWNVLRKDTEILDNLDKYRPVGGVEIERGVATSGDGSKRYPVGAITIGGSSGLRIQMYVNNETYEADDGTQTRYLAANAMVFLGAPEAIKGYDCFGMIVDPDAEYQARPIFPKNYVTQERRVKIEHLSFESAPIMVPINPNATYKLTPVA